MNFYIVVEGVTEKLVYSKWIPEICPNLTEIRHIDHATQNNFYIVQGGGMPSYFDVIRAGVEDVHNLEVFDRLVVCIDSEDQSRQEKYDEILQVIAETGFAVDFHVAIQYYCFETWALGNRRIMARTPQSIALRKLKTYFDVSTADPALLSVAPGDSETRAQLATRYLRAMINECYRNLSYMKGSPGPVMHAKYLEQIKRRVDETGHIASFSAFLSALA